MSTESKNTTSSQHDAKLLVSGSLLSDEEIREAADEWVFDKNGMKWSNNDDTAGDNYGSFMAGVKWALSRLCNDR